jgi:transcriptional regulator with XRE-family HTH domain
LEAARVAIAANFLAALGHAARARRLELGLSQEEVSLESGVAQNSISRLENGKDNITYYNLKRLTDALEIPASELLAHAERIEASVNTSGMPEP